MLKTKSQLQREKNRQHCILEIQNQGQALKNVIKNLKNNTFFSGSEATS
jgi:hypothetical protein